MLRLRHAQLPADPAAPTEGSRRCSNGTSLESERRVIGNYPATRDDDCAAADRIDFFEYVSGDDDDLVARHLVDERAHFVLLVRVEAVGGLVENQTGGSCTMACASPHGAESLWKGSRWFDRGPGQLQAPDDGNPAARAAIALETAQISDEFQEPRTLISP